MCGSPSPGVIDFIEAILVLLSSSYLVHSESERSQLFPGHQDQGSWEVCGFTAASQMAVGCIVAW